MPSLDHEAYTLIPALASFARLAATTASLLVNTYSYNDMKRAIEVDEDEEVQARDGEDPLGEMLVEGLEALTHIVKVGRVEIEV